MAASKKELKSPELLGGVCYSRQKTWAVVGAVPGN